MRGRHLEVIDTWKNGARERDMRGEGAPAREAEKRPWKSFPTPYQITWQLLPDLPIILTENISPRTNKRAKWLYIYILSLSDELGYLTIERCSNKPTINTQHYIVFNQRHDTYEKTQSKMDIFQRIQAVYYKKLNIALWVSNSDCTDTKATA